MLRLTPVVKNLLIINVLFFIAQVIAQKFGAVAEFATCYPGYDVGLKKDIVTGYLAMWNVTTLCFKPYQLFTYMFLHDTRDIFHILFNMMGLVFFGPILESYWGTKKFTLFYMITGLGAGIFYMLMNFYFGTGFSIMLGASGAVYGVLTAFGLTFPNMELRLLFLPVSFKAKYMVLIMGLMTIYSSFKASAHDNTAHFAHLGGIVIAIIMIQFWRGKGNY